MIKVVANSYIKSEFIDEYLKLNSEVVELTNANDKGCIRYELCRDTQDPLHFIMLEEWESMEDLNAHMQSEHFKRIIPQLAPFSDKDGAVSLFEKVF